MQKKHHQRCYPFLRKFIFLPCGKTDYFPDKTIINRAFGGSRLFNLNYYAEDLLNPINQNKVVIYCGENDIAHAEKPSAKEVFKRFKQFYKTVRTIIQMPTSLTFPSNILK